MEKELLFLIFGLIGLWFGSGIAIDFGRKIAEALKVSTLIIGLTVTSIGTSLGEIVTNIVAGLHRARGIETSGLAVGTVIGSNISLITFVLGFCSFFTVYYLEKKKSSMKRDWGMLFFAIGLMFLFSITGGKINAVEGGIMILAYGAYIFLLLKGEKVFKKVAGSGDNGHKLRLALDLFMVFVGVVIVIYAANLIIDSGVLIANEFKVNSELIGILIGFGTSLPELTISLHSIFKGAHGLSIGNLIGGGITDPLLSLGIGAFIAPIFVDGIVLFFDIPFMFISTLVAWLFFMRGGKLDKLEASMLIGIYGIFVYLKFFVL
ncbi:hypothetical protein J4458_01600 [Candidatus Woesearchaeota archaeon]|nr:hypothetical protein [Candidatus Woesearchaeota archaeon]